GVVARERERMKSPARRTLGGPRGPCGPHPRGPSILFIHDTPTATPAMVCCYFFRGKRRAKLSKPATSATPLWNSRQTVMLVTLRSAFARSPSHFVGSRGAEYVCHLPSAGGWPLPPRPRDAFPSGPAMTTCPNGGTSLLSGTTLFRFLASKEIVPP